MPDENSEDLSSLMSSSQEITSWSCQARCESKTTPAVAAYSAVIFRGPLLLPEEEPQEPAEEGVYRYQYPLGPVHPREPCVFQEEEALQDLWNKTKAF
jgi:hypothetical protein